MTNSHYFPTLEVNLAAVARNYTLLRNKISHGRMGAVVKANSYGLGALPVSTELHKSGCRDFFVATLDEAIELRTAIGTDNIYVFHGLRPGQTSEFLAHKLIPILNTFAQVELWNNAGSYALHIDSGMTRLGITPEEAERFALQGQKAWGNLVLIVSHLACASDEENPKNAQKLELFRKIRPLFAGIPASFANSSGICLGPDYHFDLGRPGRALYGITRGTRMLSEIENVVNLSAPVLQYRTITSPQTVGYSATASAGPGTVLATLEIGYADGFLRSLGNKICGYVDDIRVPIIGLVSMDMIIVDVTTVPENLRTPDMRVSFIGKQQPIDKVAEAVNTIGYEIFTRLGRRVKRIYTHN